MIFKKYKKIKVDNEELGLTINALNELRTRLIQEEKEIDFVNDLLLKYICVLEK